MLLSIFLSSFDFLLQMALNGLFLCWCAVKNLLSLSLSLWWHQKAFSGLESWCKALNVSDWSTCNMCGTEVCKGIWCVRWSGSRHLHVHEASEPRWRRSKAASCTRLQHCISLQCYSHRVPPGGRQASLLLIFCWFHSYIAWMMNFPQYWYL